MNISFEGQVALVTGAASGLGLATAKAFAASGASVVLADWNEKEVRAAAQELADKGHKTLGIRCDVSDDVEVEAMVKQSVAKFGRLDAAYNNAGVQNVLAETADSPREDYDRIMAINLRGVWSCMKFELQQMRKHEAFRLKTATIRAALTATTTLQLSPGRAIVPCVMALVSKASWAQRFHIHSLAIQIAAAA
jgi:NAD(P)-dependent dehydrogenase (short-subunit alcohol dehydrogenase family)